MQIDKGGKSTKIILTHYNLVDKNSTKNVLLIGIYEGDKDDREVIRAIFGSIFDEFNAINSSNVHVDIPYTRTVDDYKAKKYRKLNKSQKD